MDRLITGGCLVFLGVMLLIALLASGQTGGFFFNLAMSLLLSGPPILLGSWLLHRYARTKAETRQARDTALEKEVLRLAERKNGIVSLPEVVAETSLSSAEAEKVLQNLVSRGFANIKTSDAGALLYEFFFDLFRKEESAEPAKQVQPPDRITE